MYKYIDYYLNTYNSSVFHRRYIVLDVIYNIIYKIITSFNNFLMAELKHI